MSNFHRGLLVGVLTTGAFAAGLLCGPGGGMLAASPDGRLILPGDDGPQGRGSGPPISIPGIPGSGGGGIGIGPGSGSPPEEPDGPLVYEGSGGQGGSANGFIAVTGSYGVGTSVLYILDTEKRQLAVYEARGGSIGSRRLTLVGARRIDLDLQLEGYNDDSEFSYRKLQDLLERRGRKNGAVDAPAGGSPGKSGSAQSRK